MYTAADLRDLSCDFTERLLLNAVRASEAVSDSTLTPESLGFPADGASDPIAQFFSLHPADISPSVYVRRIRKYANCSNSVYLYALAILGRLERLDGRLRISAYNMHRLLITSVMISAKFLDHAWYSSKYYARVGGISTVAEMNGLEITMLQLLDFRIFLPLNEVLSVLYTYCDTNGKDEEKKEGDKGKNAIVIVNGLGIGNGNGGKSEKKQASGRMGLYLRKKKTLLIV